MELKINIITFVVQTIKEYSPLKYSIMKVNSFEDYKSYLVSKFDERLRIAESDFNQACSDCLLGVYDKWFRYHRSDDGTAYDLGWQFANKTIQNDAVRFIEQSR